MPKWVDKYHNELRAILFAIFLVNGIFYIPRQSITADEGDHYNYAVRFVKGHPEKIRPYDDASAMPVSAFNTIPRDIEQLVRPGVHRNDYGYNDIMNGRYVTVIISLLIGMYVYFWARNLYGKPSALVSLFFFVFCPNISAHASLVTTDAYSALFTIAPLYHYWRYGKEKSLKHLIFFSIALAMAQLAKQSLTFLYPLFFLLFLIRLFYTPRKAIRLKKILLSFVIIGSIQLVIINLGFQFKQTGLAMGGYNFKSKFFTSLQESSPFLKTVPLPFPSPYLYGLDYTKNIDEIGPGHPESSPKIYLMGETREGNGFWNYYLVSLLFKTPVPLLVAFIFAIAITLKKNPRHWYENELVLLFPVLFFLIYFDFFYNSQVGLRHILMIFPLIHVFCGVIVKEFPATRWKVFFIGALLSYSLISFYYFFPYLLPYTNELIPDKKQAYKILGSANIDYHQADKYLTAYLQKNSDVHYAPIKPIAGKFIISTNDLLELDKKKGYGWLRDNFKPVDHLVFTYLIFDVSGEQLTEKRLLTK